MGSLGRVLFLSTRWLGCPLLVQVEVDSIVIVIVRLLFRIVVVLLGPLHPRCLLTLHFKDLIFVVGWVPLGDIPYILLRVLLCFPRLRVERYSLLPRRLRIHLVVNLFHLFLRDLMWDSLDLVEVIVLVQLHVHHAVGLALNLGVGEELSSPLFQKLTFRFLLGHLNNNQPNR